MIGQRPRKRLGQHFLRDRAIVDRIIATFTPRPQDCVVEIGPGDGALTRELAPRVATLHAIELDRDLAAALATELGRLGNVVIHQSDALAFNVCALGRPERKVRVIGNLPYNISTPLLFHLLDQTHCIEDMCFMLQREVVERICALPGGKTYGRLSVMVQWRCQVAKLFNVRPGAFSPSPKVDSTVMRLVPHATPPVTVADAVRFAAVVAAAFAQRRKTLRNALKELLSAEELQGLGIDPKRRGETLSLQEFATLANALARKAGASPNIGVSSFRRL